MAVVLAWYGSPKSRWAIFVPYIEILFYWQRPRSQGRPQGYFRNPGNSEVQWHSGGGVAMPVYFGYPSHVCLWVCDSNLLLGAIFVQPFQHIGLCRLRQCLWSCSERTQARAWFDTCSSGAGSLAAAGEPPLGGGQAILAISFCLPLTIQSLVYFWCWSNCIPRFLWHWHRIRSCWASLSCGWPMTTCLFLYRTYIPRTLLAPVCSWPQCAA